MKVLVFEADSEFAKVLQDGLARLGCETEMVDDANAGLQAVGGGEGRSGRVPCS